MFLIFRTVERECQIVSICDQVSGCSSNVKCDHMAVMWNKNDSLSFPLLHRGDSDSTEAHEQDIGDIADLPEDSLVAGYELETSAYHPNR